MDVAAVRLRDTNDTLARCLAYTSEYAFNRAFTKDRHMPPGHDDCGHKPRAATTP
jgi:hypothetical protein